jgi:hypothetical protein
MSNKNNKSEFWIRKFHEKGWADFRELEVGSVFETSVSNHIQMADRIDDIIFWYRTDKDKGIYFITQVISAPYPGDNNTGYWMDLKVLKTIIDNPVKTDEHEILKVLMEKVNKMGQGGSTYNITAEDEPEKIYDLIKGKEEIELKEDGVKEINLQDLQDIENIKEIYLKEDHFFNPFVDTNLAKSEVRHLHFITNLINQNGSHMQGDKFLKLFIEELLAFDNLKNDKNLQNFCKSENVKVQTEYNTGSGRIDMWLENDEFIIAIEGKTETEDHYGQLNKYDKFLQQQGKPYLLFYLTKYSDAPKFESPESVILIGFHDTVLPFIQNILNIENLPNKIHYIADEYCNALTIYLNDLDLNWKYKLSIVNEIIRDTNSYIKYENITRNFYRDIAKYKNSVVEDIANSFEYAKAKIERDFFGALLIEISDDLKKEGFILVVDFDTDGLDVAIDLSILSKARIKRLSMYDENKDLRDISCYKLYFAKNIGDNEYLSLGIQNDYFGLSIFVYHMKDDQEINYFEKDSVILEPNLFYSNNIDKFLDKNYMEKCIQECKTKILNELKQIDINVK